MGSGMKRVISCFVMCAFLLFVYTGIEAKAETSRINISTVEDLVAIKDNLNGNYVLTNDIDLTGKLPRNGWNSTGTFKGTFDGNGYTISGLWGKEGSYKGLFSIVDGAEIRNLNIVLSEEGLTGGYEVGAVAGTARNATVIENVTVTGGTIKVTGGGYAGGIVGYFDGNGKDGKLINVKVINTKTYTSGNYSGGVVGFANRITIENASTENTVSEADIYAGGLVGAAYGSRISGSSSIAEVSTRSSYAGGFVGAIYGQTAIMDCSAQGNAVKAGGSYSGGFVGTMYENSSIERSFTTVKEISAKSEYGGGFAGEIKGGSVTGACAVGNVYANNVAGGFAAIAYSGAKLAKINALGNVFSDVNYAGGSIGKLHGGSSLEQSSAYGNVKSDGYVVGGLVGEVAGNSTVSNTYARGNVSGTTGVGGLVGYFSGSGRVQKHTVYNSYSTGTVTGNGSNNELGAFSGRSGVTFNGTNYYNTELAGVSIPNGQAGDPQGTRPVGKSTADMMKQETFEGWDFDEIWNIDEDSTYPYFDFCGFTPEVKDPVTKAPVVNNAWTADKRITGTGIAGAELELTFAGGQTVTVTVGSNGKWYAAVPGTVTLVVDDLLKARQKEADKKWSGYGQGIVLERGLEASVVKNWESSSGSKSVIPGDEVVVTVTITVDRADGEWKDVVLDEVLNRKVQFVDGSVEVAGVEALNYNYEPDNHKVIVEFGELSAGDVITVKYIIIAGDEVRSGEDIDSSTKVNGSSIAQAYGS